MGATVLKMLPTIGLRAWLRKRLNPPRTYSRCSGCKAVKVRRWRASLVGMDHMRRDSVWDDWGFCGVYRAVPASSLAAQKARMR